MLALQAIIIEIQKEQCVRFHLSASLDKDKKRWAKKKKTSISDSIESRRNDGHDKEQRLPEASQQHYRKKYFAKILAMMVQLKTDD